MTIASLPMLPLRALTVLAFLTAAFCLLGLVQAWSIEAKPALRLLYIFTLLLAIALLHSFTAACIQAQSPGAVRGIGQAAHLILALPLWAILPLFAALLFCLLRMRHSAVRQASRQLTSASLQEGLNQMPDGVCFSTADGIPLLVNPRMQAISREAIGSGMLDANRFRRRLTENDLLPGCRCRMRRGGEAATLRLAGGSVWDIRWHVLDMDGAKVQECIAYDITEQDQKTREMEARNARHAALNDWIRAYGRDLDAITREKEMLAAKIRIHDDVGRCLLSLRTYLAGPADTRTRGELVELWRFTMLSLLQQDAGRDLEPADRDQMEALAQAARAVGVRLIFEGEIPADPAVREVAVTAIHECLTNTVKHAGGDELTVHSSIEDRVLTLLLRGNGRRPAGEIEEKGGLRSLRRITEQHGGQMAVYSEPGFLLQITLPYPTGLNT